ncbi:hypothetical protein ABPG74_007152 [Tetrahymena malaccensis]
MNLALLLKFYIIVKTQPYVRECCNNMQQKSIMLCAFSLNNCFIQINGGQNNLIFQDFLTFILIITNLLFVFSLVIGLSRLLIPTQEEDRNLFQNFIFKIKQKYPQLLNTQMQYKHKIRALLKLRKKTESQQQSQLLQSEVNEEKEFIVQSDSPIKMLRKKWSYYSRLSNSNQTSLKSSIQTPNILSPKYLKNDQILETENFLQNSNNISNSTFKSPTSQNNSILSQNYQKDDQILETEGFLQNSNNISSSNNKFQIQLQEYKD